MKDLESLIRDKSNSETVPLEVRKIKQIMNLLEKLSQTAANNYLKQQDAESRLKTLKEKLGIEGDDTFLQD